MLALQLAVASFLAYITRACSPCRIMLALQLAVASFLGLANPASPALFSLKDTARPGLSITEGGQQIAWWEGGPAFALASAGAVRVNFRAVYTYPPHSLLRDLNLSDWHGLPCNASAWALCATDVGQAMPSISPRMPENSLAVVADGWKDLACSNSAGKLLVSLGVYDISACDILDEGLDLVYSQGMLYHRHNTLDIWEYWVLVALAIVLVRSLSHNIKRLWEPAAQDTTQQWPALLAALTALVIVLVDGDSLFITSADQVFYWSTAVYILVYLAIHATYRWLWKYLPDWLALERQTGLDYPVFNVIVATLQFIACRFYMAAETPYNLVLFTILACRGWYAKTHKTHKNLEVT